jgi:hypothetical protein
MMSRMSGTVLISIPLLLILIATSIDLFTMGSEGQGVEGPQELNLTTLHLAEGMSLSPLDHDQADEYQAVGIPNGFARTGFRGLGIVPVGDTVWKEVGTWYTEPLKQQINLGGVVEVEAWAYKEETDGTSPTSQFRFEIMKGNEVLLSLGLGGTTIREGNDVRLSATGAFPPGNDTTIEGGTSMAFRIFAKSNGGGATIRFGNPKYDSRFTFFSNSLEIRDIRMTKKEAILEYKDAFMVPWTNLYTQLEIDRVKVPDDGISSMMNSLNYTREIHWERRSGTGEYTVFASIGYCSGQNLSDQRLIEIKENRESWFRLENFQDMISSNMLLIVILIIVVAVILTLARRRRKVWTRRYRRLPQNVQDGSKKEKQKAWKEIYKEKRLKRKELRQMRIVDEDEEPDEDEMEEKEFTLFKKKVLGNRYEVEVEDVEELEL